MKIKELSIMFYRGQGKGIKMGIRSKLEETALEKTQILTFQAQAQYIQWLMKEEGCDYEEAIAIVQGRTEPLEIEYMLGYKMADPALMIALFKQPGKRRRMNAALNFAETLTDDEKIVFWRDVFNAETCKSFKEKLKKEKKKKGIEDDPENVD